jgi:peroxiredoxin
MAYNHGRFRLSDYELTEFPGPRAGEPAPDFELTGLDGNPVQISSFRGRWLVLETASVSCMMYARNVSKIVLLRQKYPDVEWLVVYVREVHPGRRRPAHKDMAQKLTLARSLKGDYGESRTVAVDTISGDMHRAYGSLPNMVYVLNPDGKVVYRCDWLSVPELDRVLARRPKIEANQHTLTDDLHYPSIWLTARILWRSGFVAVWDFLRAAPQLLPAHRVADGHYLAQQEESTIAPKTQ